MSKDRIERETLIAAPLARVWSLVTEPGFWVTGEDNRTGATAEAGELTVARHDEHGEFPVRVVRVDPRHYVAYRWASAFAGAEPNDDNSTLVEFTLAEEGGKTRLRVVESGFAALGGSDELRTKAFTDNTEGWAAVLDALAAAAEQTQR